MLVIAPRMPLYFRHPVGGGIEEKEPFQGDPILSHTTFMKR
jgi:hypothetical protein